MEEKKAEKVIFKIEGTTTQSGANVDVAIDGTVKNIAGAIVTVMLGDRRVAQLILIAAREYRK